MRTPTEIMERLVPVMQTTIKAYQIGPQQVHMSPIKETMHQMQMAVFWLREARTKIEGVLEEGTKFTVKSKAIPTMLTFEEHLDFIKTELDSLSKELLEETALVFSTETIELTQAALKLKEAYFNIQLTITYYDEIKRQLAFSAIRSYSTEESGGNDTGARATDPTGDGQHHQ